MFWFLAPLIVWHVCYPVTSVMFRSCRHLFAWHVKIFSVASSKWSPLKWSIDLFWDWSSGFKLMVDEVILKKQVTSYFLAKNITAITKVITDVWRKGWARSIGALGLGLGDPLASLDQREFLIDVRWRHSASFRTFAWLNDQFLDAIRQQTYEPLLPTERLRGGDPGLLLAGTVRLHGAHLSFCSTVPVDPTMLNGMQQLR